MVAEKFHIRSSRPEVFCKKGVLRNFAKFTGKHLWPATGLQQACNFIKKDTLAQVFSCEFCEISKNTFFYRTPLVAASVKCSSVMMLRLLKNISLSQKIKSAHFYSCP